MQWWRAPLPSIARLWWIPWGSLALLCACAFVPQQNEWIVVGHTMRDEVVEAYGEPDMVMETAEGETVVYRPVNVSRSLSPLEVPTAQAGPGGRMMTKMETTNRGLGVGSKDEGLKKRPDHELRIRYDAHGIVRELIQ